MSSVFENIDAEKLHELDQWVFDRLPLSAEQKAELLRSLVAGETVEELETQPVECPSQQRT
jgi:hypothetical protein